MLTEYIQRTQDSTAFTLVHATINRSLKKIVI